VYPEIAVHGQYRRLIPSKYPTIDIYERFGSPEMRVFAAELEKVTNPRLAAKSRLTGGDTSADSGSPRLQNWNHAPFAYPVPEGTYMLPEPYSVMELAGDERGALARAIVRREEFLARTQEPSCGVDMRMITNRVFGTFVDLRELPPDLPTSARHKLGQRIYEDGAQGVVFRMAELPGHDFASIFTLDALPDKGVQGAHYRFRWDGRQIHRIYSFGENRDIDRGDILSLTRVAA
jgi:hypothetical protein